MSFCLLFNCVCGWMCGHTNRVLTVYLWRRYVTVLGAVYLRLVGKPVDVYAMLEPLYSDYRKIRKRIVIGTATVYRIPCVQYCGVVIVAANNVLIMLILIGWEITHVDEIVDALLNEEYYIDLALPRLVDREFYEKNGTLPPRKSVLEDELDGSDSDDDDDDDADDADE